MNLNDIPFGTIEKFNTVIEVTEGSRNKYEMDEGLGHIVLDFIFSPEFRWLHNYGFIAGTRGGDGDRLDVMVISSTPLEVGGVVPCRAVGIVELLDRGEVDNKVLAVPVADSFKKDIQTLEDLGEEFQVEVSKFYEQIAREKNKTMEIKGFHGKERAEQEIKNSLE